MEWQILRRWVWFHLQPSAFDYVGMPEGRYHLAQACLYLSTAPKSNSAFAFFDAISVVRQEQADEVPDPLKRCKPRR